jgi:hypothetical protein
MSSEISIDRPAALENRPAPVPARADDQGFRPWHFFVLASILMATVAVVLARQNSAGHLILLSLTIAAAGAAAAALHRTLVPLLGPARTPAAEPIGARARALLEREKLLVLRSIKELEFDRAMGKLSPQDFDEMAGRLRSRALSLMQQLDVAGGPYERTIESELRARLAATSDRPAAPPAQTVPACAACGASNDSDAVFCKKCGTRLRP